jgi:hypothetical protein
MIFIGQASLRRAVAEYTDHYHRERNHQGLENRLIHAPAVVANQRGSCSFPAATSRNGQAHRDLPVTVEKLL